MALLKQNRSLIATILIVLVVLALATNGMSAPTAVSILLSGITLGALYFLVAGGLSLIFGLMDVLNFAHGSLFMLGAYMGWTVYTNPRLIFNVAPLAFAFAAAALSNSITGRAFLIARPARWLAALVAAALVIYAVRDFPLDRLVAFGTTVTGQVIPTAQAEEPLTTMLVRVGLMFAAGLALSLAMGARGRDVAHISTRRTVATAVALAGLALVTLLLRDAGEQFILSADSNLRFVLALGVGGLAGALLGALMEWGLIRPLYARPIYQILLTLGLVFVADQAVRLVWGPAGAFMDMPSAFNSASANCPAPNLLAWLSDHCDSILVLGRPFPSYRLFIIAVGVVIVIGVAILLQRSRLGMIIRAGVQDSEMVEALGINVRRVFTLVFALGAGLAGLGGVVAAPFLGVYPGMALEFLLQAFIVVVIGGLGSVPGAALGALLVGLARAYGDNLVLAGVQLPWMSEAVSGSPAIARASTVLIMVLVLLIKPTGIFGKKE
jgi:branched-chain amino acid transport system permease protein